MNLGDVLAGDGALYKVEATVATESWANFNVEFKGGDGFAASNLRIGTTGTVSYIPPTWLVTEKTDDTIKVCYFTDLKEIQMLLYCTFFDSFYLKPKNKQMSLFL